MNIRQLYGMHDFWLSIGQPLQTWLVSLGVPSWLVSLVYVLIGAATILGMITVFVIIAIWAERRFIARLQDRRGPNRVGKFGLLQSVADAVKLLGKEIIRPEQADAFLHFLAPALINPQGGKVCRNSKFKGPRMLASSGVQSLLEQ